MRCDAIMKTDPPTVRSSDSVSSATTKLISRRELNLPVVDEAGRYVGMFGSEDLLNLIVPRVALAGNLTPNLRFIGDDSNALTQRYRELKQQTAEAVADRNAIVVAPDTPVVEAFRIFCRDRSSLAVVEPGTRKLVGVVSYWDAVEAITGGA